MAKKGEFILEFHAESLGLSLENLAEEADAAFKKAIEEVAVGAYATIQAKAQHGLNSTLDDYRGGLTFQRLENNSYLISLEGDYPNALENGYPGFSIREKMLNSAKIVEVGARAGLPWVQKAKSDGHKFAHVPFSHKPFTKALEGADLGQILKKLKGQDAKGNTQRLTKIFRDANGNAIDSGIGKETRAVAKAIDADGNLAGLVKFQKVTKAKTGKETVQSIYMTWRTVSEAGKDWVHPSFKGLHAFLDVESWVAEQLDSILKAFLG